MSYGIGRGRYARETYPEPPRSLGGGVDTPFVNLVYVDYNTTVPVPKQNGSDESPYGTVQAAIDAGRFAIFITGGDISEDVVVPAGQGVWLTAPNTTAVLNSLTLPDTGFALIEDVQIGAVTGGSSCFVKTDAAIGQVTFGDGAQFITSANMSGTAIFGAGCFFVTNGPGALSFTAKIDQLQIGNFTMGEGSAVVATNTIFAPGTSGTADTVEMFGCTSLANLSVGALNAQNSAITAGTITSTGSVDMQDVKVEAGVIFDNAIGPAFNVDGYTNYWLKTNAVVITDPGAKVITEDLAP